MCTSVTIPSLDHHHFLARTMDFPTTTLWRPIFLPRHYHWQTAFRDPHTTRYGILGGGRLAATTQLPLMADGVNENGLACAELYLPGRVHYHPAPVTGQINLAAQDFINWVLGEHATIAEVVADLPQVALVQHRASDTSGRDPFHWILSDATGATVVIEPTHLTLVAQADPAGILTNTPTLADHFQHLNDVIGVAGQHFTSATITGIQAYVAANQPIPTGAAPTHRFVNMALHRWSSAPQPATQTIASLFHWLDAVAIPLDPTRLHRSNHNYTHYEGVLDLTSLTYYFLPRTSHRLQTVTMSVTMLENVDTPQVYPDN